MSLRSILGGSGRVKKPGNQARGLTGSPSSSPRKAGSGGSSSSGSGVKKKTSGKKKQDIDEDFFADRLDDYGLVKALAADLSLRDVPQAMRYARERMFSPLPQAGGTGMSPARVAEVLNYRRRLPPVVTMAHLHALLASPTAVEREADELVRAGVVRRVVVLRRGGIGELLIRSEDLEGLVRAGAAVDEQAREAFLAFLSENPAAQRLPRASLPAAHADQLVRAGFLTAYATHDVGTSTSIFSRPEDRTTLTSLEIVSRAASGSVGAVGGEGVVHAAGGTGGRSAGADNTGGTLGDLTLAVPGNGAFLKLVAAALEHLTSILARAPHKEAPETLLREKWDGGVAHEEDAQHQARRARGEFVGILPGRTKKWKDFQGLSFDWLLQEAVGTGKVEVFDTRSVGRGIRLV